MVEKWCKLRLMTSQERVLRPPLPRPETRAFFPQIEANKPLREHIIKRVGEENLVWAMQYGSQVGGDAGKRSMYDVMVVVDDIRAFHERNMTLRPFDYGLPHSVKWHTLLNRFGFNFYHSHYIDGNEDRSLKLAVISKDNFIRGCSGTLSEGEKNRSGAFGMYVAGRIQKAALSPLFKREQDSAVIEAAINTARIDGVWYALGFLNKKFTYDELLKTYVSLSYRADVRIEKRKKIETLINNNKADYKEMLEPIIQGFIDQKLIKIEEEGFGWYEKVHSLSVTETQLRLLKLKRIAFLTNYLKNPLTAGLTKGIVYAMLKIARAADSVPIIHRAVEKLKSHSHQSHKNIE